MSYVSNLPQSLETVGTRNLCFGEANQVPYQIRFQDTGFLDRKSVSIPVTTSGSVSSVNTGIFLASKIVTASLPILGTGNTDVAPYFWVVPNELTWTLYVKNNSASSISGKIYLYYEYFP